MTFFEVSSFVFSSKITMPTSLQERDPHFTNRSSPPSGDRGQQGYSEFRANEDGRTPPTIARAMQNSHFVPRGEDVERWRLVA